MTKLKQTLCEKMLKEEDNVCLEIKIMEITTEWTESFKITTNLTVNFKKQQGIWGSKSRGSKLHRGCDKDIENLKIII